MGPYKIVQVISPTAYKLDLPATMRIHPMFHVSLLKPYQASNEFLRPIPPPAITLSDFEHKEYKVKTILNKRVLRNKPQYLVKWMGYPLHDATWEPLEHLKNAREKVQEFEKTRTSFS